MPRVIVHLERAASMSHAIPLLHVMRQRAGWTPLLTMRERTADYPSGLGPIHVERLRRLDLPLHNSPLGLDGDVLITFDNVEGRWDNVGLKVRVPASLLGKGVRYRDGITAAKDNLPDLLLVPGPAHLDYLNATNHVFTPMAAVGLPGLDPLLGDWLTDREALRAQLRMAGSSRVLLYAPTWEPELSSWPVLWTRIRHLANDHTGLVLRPHPRSPHEFRRACRLLAEQHENITLAVEPDIQPYLKACDLVISDHSSLAWEAALAGKPVVRVNNPNRVELDGWSDRMFDRTLPEPGPLVRELDELIAAVDDELAQPQRVASRRAELISRLLPADDDNACNRVLNQIEDALVGHFPVVSWPRGVRAQLRVQPQDSSDQIEITLTSILDRGGEPATVWLSGDSAFAPAELSGWQARWPDRIQWISPGAPPPPANSPFELLVTAGIDGAPGWTRRLADHLRRRSAPNGVAPLIVHGRPAQDPSVLGIVPELDDTAPHALDRAQRVRAAGTALVAPVPASPDAVMIAWDSKWGPDLVTRWQQDDWPRRGGRFAVKVAADVVAERPPLPQFTTPPSDPLTRQRLEDRVVDLAAWVQRVLPEGYESTPAPAASRPSAAPQADLPGPLRLAAHYLDKGKPDRAIPLIEAALQDADVHPAALELAVRARLTAPTGTEAPS